MITSRQNPLIKSIRALQKNAKKRKAAGAFVVEGVRLAEEAQAAGWPIRSVLHSEELSERGWQVIKQFQQQGVKVEACSPEVMQAASDTQSPQGLLLVLEEKSLPTPASPEFILILDAIADPGNMGSLLRTALGAGVETVLLGPGGVDAYAPKVLRSAMGAHFRLPIKALSWPDMRRFIQAHKLATFVSDVEAGEHYAQAELQTPLALILGGEAYGVSEEARALTKHSLNIPMQGELESLNAAAAGAILLFEIAQQRRSRNKP